MLFYNFGRKYPVTIKILLEPEQPIYAPGDYLQGKVIVSHRGESMRVKGTKLSLQGSFAKFNERKRTYDKEDIFLEQSTYVYGGEELQRGMSHLPPGTHAFPFRLQLPSSQLQLPSTFKTQFGVVTYQLIAYHDVEVTCVKKGEKTFIVHGDVPVDPGPPIVFEKVERCSRRGGGRGSGGSLCPKYSVHVPSTGFVVGQAIQFEVRADNCEHVDKKGSVALLLKIAYRGRQVVHALALKDSTTVIGEVLNENVGSSWRAGLPIPNDVPPTFTGATVEFRYSLRVSLKSQDGTQIFKLERPVVIGTCGPGWPPGDNIHWIDFTGISDARLRRLAPFDLASLRGSLPSYSTLSLRTVGSFETLPPNYDEIMDGLENENEQDADSNEAGGAGASSSGVVK